MAWHSRGHLLWSYSSVIIALLCVCTASLPVDGYKIGVLADTSNQRGQRFRDFAILAVEDLAAEVSIELVVNNTQSAVTQATIVTMYQVQTAKVVGIVGPMSTTETHPVAYGGAATKTPVLAPVAASAFSDKITFPTFFRPRPNDSDVVTPLTTVVAAMGWTRVGILAEGGTYGAGLFTMLGQKHVPFEYDQASFEPYPSTNMYNTMVQGLKGFKAAGVRIFAIHMGGTGNQVGNVFTAMKALGILNNPKYQVLLMVDIADNIASTPTIDPADLTGIMGIMWNYPYEDLKYLQLLDRAKTRWGYPLARAQDLQGYDSVIGLGRAIIAVEQSGKPVTGDNVAQVLRNITYQGIMGQYKFNSYQDRPLDYALVNWKGDSLQATVAGILAQDGTYSSRGIVFTYPGHAAGIVWDGFSLADGETLAPTQTGALSALAFFVSTLSGWSAVVLIEQSVYAVTKRKRHMLWTLLSAGLFGSCGVWGGIVINVGSVSLGTLGHVALKPDVSIGLLFACIALTVLAYISALKGVRRLTFPNEAKENKGSKHKMYGTQEASITASSKGSVTAISSGKSSESIEEDEQARTAKAQFTGLRSKFNRWLALGVLLLTGTQVLTIFLLFTQGFQPIFKSASQAGYIFLTILLMVIFHGSGLLFLFHFMPQTPSRGVAAIFMGLGVYIPTQVTIMAADWTYRASGVSTDVSTYWQYENVSLGLSVLTVLLCLALVAYNVFSMKLSRNSLDVHLAQFKRQFKLMTQQVDGYKEYINSLHKQKEELWKIIELISISRPLARDHALALALSDFEKDHVTLQAMVQSEKDKQADAQAQGLGLVPNDVVATKPRHQEASIMHCYEQIIKQQNNSNHREIRLEDILAHPVTLELLKDAMAKNMDAESLMLYLDIQRYKQLSNQKVRAFMAREIYDTFLARGAKYEVNVSDTLRRSFDSRFAYDKGQLSPAAENALPIDLFNDMEREMRVLLQTNGMARLQSTGGHILCGQILSMLKAPTAPANFSAPGPSSPKNAVTAININARSGSPYRPSPPGAIPSPKRGSVVVSPTASTPTPRGTLMHQGSHGSPRPSPTPGVYVEPSTPSHATPAWTASIGSAN